MSLEWLILNSITGLGPARIARLIECFGSPRAVLASPADSLCQAAGIGREIANRIRDQECAEAAGRQIEQAGELGITILTLDHESYPVHLREIFAPPPVLYVKGDLSAFSRHAVAVVGTRVPSAYGKEATAFIAKGLVARKLAVVSGLAAGIDTVAHQTVVEGGGITIAVQGCGLDMVYPSSNRALAERIMEKGALVSEFPLGTGPQAHNFPRRNRIISGLSAGVVVVEAGLKSGGLITSNYALQQGRDVFAVPGPIFSDKSIGTFNLIKGGAVPVRSADDIMESIQTLSNRTLFTPPPAAINAVNMSILSTREKEVLLALSETPLRLDQLGEKIAVPAGELFNVLLNLELNGLIRQSAGQQYIRVAV